MLPPNLAALSSHCGCKCRTSSKLQKNSQDKALLSAHAPIDRSLRSTVFNRLAQTPGRFRPCSTEGRRGWLERLRASTLGMNDYTLKTRGQYYSVFESNELHCADVPIPRNGTSIPGMISGKIAAQIDSLVSQRSILTEPKVTLPNILEAINPTVNPVGLIPSLVSLRQSGSFGAAVQGGHIIKIHLPRIRYDTGAITNRIPTALVILAAPKEDIIQNLSIRRVVAATFGPVNDDCSACRIRPDLVKHIVVPPY